MSVDRIYLQRSARNIEESPSYVPYSKVRIIVGEEEDGTQLVYEAGDDTFRTLEITNPYGTQAVANSILAKIQGYSYKPYKADGAILNPAAELGDAVNVGEVYSFLSGIDTTFSPVMSADISAPEDSNIDHEYPYEASENKEIARKINGAKASFIVEIGRIEASLEDYQKKEDMDGYVEERTLNASIGAYIDSSAGTAKVVNAASGTYQRKDQMGNYVLSSSLNTSIGQYIDSQAGTAKVVAAASGTYQTKAGMSDYVAKSSLNTSIGQYIDSSTGKAKIVSAVSGTYQTKSGMSDYVAKSSLDASITAHINTQAGIAEVTSAVSATYQRKDAMGNYVLNSNLNNSITQYVNSTTGKNSIVASVSGSFAGKSYENKVELNESKLSWLIKSGTSASNFTMTDRAIQLTAGSINLSGYVTFASLSTKGSTSINGDNITTGTIKASLIETDKLKLYSLWVPFPYDFPLIYTDTSRTGVDMYVGSKGGESDYNLRNIQIRSSQTVEIARYVSPSSVADGVVFDISTRTIKNVVYNRQWSLGASGNQFKYIYVEDIEGVTTVSFGRTDIAYSQHAALQVSSTSAYGDHGLPLVPTEDKNLTLAAPTKRIESIYCYKVDVKDMFVCDGLATTKKIGFFGSSGAAKQTLSTTTQNMGYTSATASNYLIILNNICGILKEKYGLIG